MAAVKGGNGQHVHYGQNHRDKGGDVPEVEPVPGRGEDAADGAETAQALRTLRGEDEFELLDIGHELVPAHLNAARDGLQDVVMLDGCVINLGGLGEQDAQFAVAIDGHIGSGQRLPSTLVLQGDILALVLLQLGRKFGVARGGSAVDGQQAVAVLQASFLAAHAGLRL